MGALSGLTRRVAGAMSIFFGTQAFTIFCSILRTKFIAVWAGQAGIGVLAIYLAAVELLSSGGTVGLRTAAVRLVSVAGASARRSVCRAVTRLSWIVGLALGLFTALCSPLLNLIAFGQLRWSWPFALLGIVVTCVVVSAGKQAQLQGLRRLGNIAWGYVTSGVLSLAVTIPVIMTLGRESILPVVLLYGVVGAAVFLVPQRMKVPLAGKPAPGCARAIMRLGAYLTAAAVIEWMCEYVFLSWLRAVAGEGAVGLYQAGHTLSARYIGMVFTALSMEFYPRIAAASRSRMRTALFVNYELRLVTCIAAPLAVLFIAAVPWCIRLVYSADFLAVTDFVRIAVPATMLRAASWCMGFVILSRDRGRVYLLVEALSAVLTLGLNILLFGKMGLTGLGWAYLASYALYAPVVWAICRRRYGIGLSRPAVLLLVGVLALTFGAALFLVF